MILVDTSVWIDHLRGSNRALADLLNTHNVCIHPMVIGELACGNLRERTQLLGLWNQLPFITEATHREVMYNIEQHSLMGKGLGYVDIHLLASTQLSAGAKLWTQDKRLQAAASTLGIAYKAS